ncbi:hypothetical protein SAMN05216429_103118 [Marinobacter persicus]|uniref:Uncharacterized protein n=1 Tax=Marinobacter persicus TaxID=930118 RepID=A0A1I3S096_9GAMM|nr:hypothetical protein SAMN05216429_103118 [Marinobacter persicus]
MKENCCCSGANCSDCGRRRLKARLIETGAQAPVFLCMQKKELQALVRADQSAAKLSIT